MDYLVIFVSVYLLIGLIYGMLHLVKIVKVVEEAGREDTRLREMVKMYELTPSGAEYYTKLQDLHIQKRDAIAEYELYKKNQMKYLLQMFSISFVFWPYYYFSIRKKNSEKRVGR